MVARKNHNPAIKPSIVNWALPGLLLSVCSCVCLVSVLVCWKWKYKTTIKLDKETFYRGEKLDRVNSISDLGGGEPRDVSYGHSWSV